MPINVNQVKRWLEKLTDVYAENKTFLTELDSAIGDADHGINLDRGFSAVRADLAANDVETIGDAFRRTSMTLIKSVGGASGPLYGTWFLKAASKAGNVTEMDDADVVELFDLAVQGVKARGKADLGAKTMLDVWIPVVEKMKEMQESGASLEEILTEAVVVAEKQVEATIPMKALKGRASFLGERSIGHPDPGATSSMMMIRAARETLV
ncbi:MAG: dihydroxyacetone kinase subunit DhaL [Alkalispirochaeta sp.]